MTDVPLDPLPEPPPPNADVPTFMDWLAALPPRSDGMWDTEPRRLAHGAILLPNARGESDLDSWDMGPHVVWPGDDDYAATLARLDELESAARQEP